jgi:hypothetical protein
MRTRWWDELERVVRLRGIGSHARACTALTVLVNILTRDALISGNDGSVRVWQGHSIMLSGIFCHISMRGAALVIEES